MENKAKMCIPLVVLSILPMSCSNHKNPAIDLEPYLGKGWECYAAPDTFKKAGVVVELTADGKYFFDSDHSARSIKGSSAIGAATNRIESTVGGVLKLLQDFEILSDTTDITADLNRVATIRATYSGTKKWVIGGDDMRSITEIYASKDLTPNSRYFLFRESHSAESIDILIDRSIVGSLGANIDFDRIVDVNPQISRSSGNRYRLQYQSEEPLGVCAIATELLIERGFDGKIAVRPSGIFYLPDNVSIVMR